jgi:hypothetical protein
VVHVHAWGATQWNEVFSDPFPSLEGITGLLGAMMGGPEEDPCIIASGLCHLSPTLYVLGLNTQVSKSPLSHRRKSLRAHNHGLNMSEDCGIKDETSVLESG